jgi:hypothetical protein
MPRAPRAAAALLLCGLGLLGACGGDDDRPARWSYISAAIIEPNCTTSRCHSSFSSTGGLRLEGADESWAILVGYDERGNYVWPGDPARSKLMSLLRGSETWRMPPDQPLPDADIALIEQWILEGATNE